ncbi:MAG: NACHT domain-containing protein [Eubacteriales bacterium]|nr:NACHT domain-containing protein [Eubacteriales bacterium]
MELWGFLSNIGTIATIETRIREAVEHTQNVLDERRLQNVDTIMKEQELCNIRDPWMEEKLDQFIAEHAAYYKEKDWMKIFSEEEKDAVTDLFLDAHKDLLPYKDTVRNVLNQYIEKIETYIGGKMTDGEKAIYRELREQGHKLDAVCEAVEGFHRDRERKELSAANGLYYKSFMEPLFLHKDSANANVNLANLFVLPGYRQMSLIGNGDIQQDLDAYLKYFVREEKTNILFIEGDAGVGKSSLVAYLNYHYERKDKKARGIIGDRTLLTVRLRDIRTEKLKESGNLVSSILDYLSVESVERLEQICFGAVLILDGFDELCMIENMSSDAERSLYDLRAFENFKVIITTRPKYINISGLDFPKKYIVIQHFDAKQREAWLNGYIHTCRESVSDSVRDFLEKITDEDAFGICDTPMALYMIAAGKIDGDALQNEWALYHQIFYKELSETEYNKMFPNKNRNYIHDILKYRDIVYRISEEIAYRMYCTGNSRLYLSEVELKEIIADFGIQDIKTRELSERCYALCNYWKADSDRGVVEFYHNNIRDFFLCEKIFREINEEYAKIERNGKADMKSIAEKYCRLFVHGELEPIVPKFIYLRTLNGRAQMTSNREST